MQDPEEFKEEVLPMVRGGAPQETSLPPKRMCRQKSGKYIKEHIELHRTGKWGKIGKKEMLVVLAALILIVGGVIAAVLFLVVFKEEATPETLPPRPDPPTPAPSEFPENDPTEQLNAILTEIRKTTLLADNTTALLQSTLDALSTEASFYTASNSSQPAVVRAMSWVLNTDPRDVAPDSVWLIPRFALATLYYSTNGDEWTNNEGWLTAERVCDWHGVFCNRFNSAVQEIDLNTNNLAGPIPPELALVSSMYGMVLTQNKLTGAPPFTALGNMPVLSFLFLNNNQLTGEISPTVRDNQVLSKLLVESISLFCFFVTENRIVVVLFARNDALLVTPSLTHAPPRCSHIDGATQ